MSISQRFTHPQGILGVSDIPHSDEHIQSYIRRRHNERRRNIRSGKEDCSLCESKLRGEACNLTSFVYSTGKPCEQVNCICFD